jgi:protein phosphatase PTC1
MPKIKLKESDKFAILACDGLWDVLSNDLACSLASDGFRIGAPIEDICWGLVTAAINERKSSDNVSVTLLKFS